MTIDRRCFLSTGVLTFAALSATACRAAPKGKFEIDLTEADWKKRLTPAQFATLRQAATDVGSSPFKTEHRRGTYACAGCNLPDFSSRTKFESGTIWPSFWQPLPNAVRTVNDSTLGFSRTEVVCRRCGGHLGHVFDDGPPPTGKRYCINGTALKFTAA